MKKTLFIFMFLVFVPLAFALESQESLEQRVSEFELQLELAEKSVEQHEAEGKDSFVLKRAIEDYQETTEDFKISVRLHNPESAQYRLEKVWKTEIALKNAMGISRDETNEVHIREELNTELESIDVLKASIKEAQDQGYNIGSLQKDFISLQKMYEEARSLLNLEKIELAALALQKTYPEKRELKKKLASYGVDFTVGNKRTKTQAAVASLPHSLALTQHALDTLRLEGKEVTRMQNMLDEIDGLYFELVTLVEEDNFMGAYTKLQRIFVLSVDLQRTMQIKKEYKRRGNTEILQTLKDYHTHKSLASYTLARYDYALTRDALKILEQETKLIEEAEILVHTGKFSEAEKKIVQASQLDVDFQRAYSQVYGKHLRTREHLAKILATYTLRSEALHSYLAKITTQDQEFKKAEQKLKQMDNAMQNAREYYERKQEAKAWKYVHNSFVFGNVLEKIMQKIPLIDLEEIFNTTTPRIASAKLRINALESEGKDITPLRILLTEIENQILESKEFYQKGNLKEAELKLKEAMHLSKQLEILSEQIIEEHTI